MSLDTEGDCETSYDPGSLVRTADRVQLTMQIRFGGTAPTLFIGRVEMDCRRPDFAFHSGHQYGAKGELLRSRTVSAGQVEREPLFEDSPFANVYRVACPDGAPLPKLDAVQTRVIPSNDQPLP